ncbi:MAG TPA: Rrf2 family transcriptional regulator [Longimicrobiales bacterium]|nr:Rrf2 family transcriptional regulator [Longimicrobiales bacterium]
MLSQTGLYALQALLHLAEQGDGAQVPAAVMARELGVPGTYLAKVLQRLAREGILDSTRGPRGGYRLSVSPGDLTVAAAVASFQELRAPETCLLGGPCDLTNPCSAHARRTAWNAAAMEILEKTTLADLLSGAPMDDLASAVTPPSENPR